MLYLIFLFILVAFILISIYPFLIKFEFKFNVLKLKGRVVMKVSKFFKFDFRIRIKNGYIYINHKNKLKKEKLSEQSFGFMFITNLLNQMYFREQFLNLSLTANFGYLLDARTTAVGTGYIDVISKAILSKFKNNKKSSHIFISVEPKYNQDIFNFRLNTDVRISIFDTFYSSIFAWYYVRRKENEKRNKLKSKEKN